MPNQFENTGKVFKIIETDNINKVDYDGGQYIILNDGMVYYDPTTGTSLEDRVCLTPKQEVDINDRGKDSDGNWLTDEYYLSLCTRPIDDDFNIIRTPIDGTDKKEYSIYIYNNGKWNKMNEAYNAKNIYLDENIPLTIPFGHKQEVTKNYEFDTKGLSVYDALCNIFGPEIEPSIEQPSISITLDPSPGEYEIGTTLSINYELTLNPGKYEFGPDTDVKATKYKIITKDGSSYSTKSGTINNVTITDDNYYIDASITYTNGTIPNTSKKDGTFPDGSIKAGTVTKRIKFAYGYLTNIYYTCLDYVPTEDDLSNNEFIQTLNKSHYNIDMSSNSIELIVPVNTKSIILFKQESDEINSIFNSETNYDMFDAFKEITNEISINDINYNGYIYCPANPYSKETKLTISYSKNEE